jgi:hypothetical protein
MQTRCEQFDQILTRTATGSGCEECLKTNDRWVHLRVCLTCGHVICRDQSKNKHATQHLRRQATL